MPRPGQTFLWKDFEGLLLNTNHSWVIPQPTNEKFVLLLLSYHQVGLHGSLLLVQYHNSSKFPFDWISTFSWNFVCLSAARQHTIKLLAKFKIHLIQRNWLSKIGYQKVLTGRVIGHPFSFLIFSLVWLSFLTLKYLKWLVNNGLFKNEKVYKLKIVSKSTFTNLKQ